MPTNESVPRRHSREVNDRVYNALEGIKALLDMFKWERTIYLIVAVVSVIFFLIIAVKYLVLNPDANSVNDLVGNSASEIGISNSVSSVAGQMSKKAVGSDPTSQTLTLALMGSSGILAAASFRIVYFFNRSFTIVEKSLSDYLGGPNA